MSAVVRPSDSILRHTVNFEDISYLGAGSYAQVRKVWYKDKIAAVKIFKQYKQGSKYFMKEVNELRKVDHPNIIKLLSYGKWKDKNEECFCMIIEFADMGSLHHVLYETDLAYSLEHAISWLYQCANAVSYLHSMPKPIIHRDLKPLNLLLMNEGRTLKVCDFGTACDLKTLMTLEQGSPCWIAPEMLQFNNYNEKCDVYSYGIITWEVLCRLSPYFGTGYSSARIMFAVAQPKDPLRPKEISNCPKLVKLLIERSLDGNPIKRPSMQLILEILKALDVIINKEPPKPLVRAPDPGNESSETKLDANFSSGVESTNAVDKTILKAPIIRNNEETNKSEASVNTVEASQTSQSQSQLNLNNSSTSTIQKIPPSPVQSNAGWVGNNGSTDVLAELADNGQRHRPSRNLGHRKSKSYGNDFIVEDSSQFSASGLANKNQHSTTNFAQSKSTESKANLAKPTANNKIDAIKNELTNRMETMLYDPLEPLYNNNESIQIFHDHRNLIKSDEILQKKINNLRSQSEQLNQTIKNINIYNELLKQKNLLVSDINRLKNFLKSSQN